LNPVYTRNFRIHDMCLETAPDSTLGDPGIGEGLKGLSIIPQAVVEELPAECQQAFEEARAREAEWKGRFSTERTDGRRAHFVPTTLWCP